MSLRYHELFSVILDEHNHAIADVDFDEYGHKFAAVDDLLDVAQRFVDVFDADSTPGVILIEAARAAIAKAKGEA